MDEATTIRLQRGLAWLGLVVLVALAIVVTWTAQPGDGVSSIAGTWPARVVEPALGERTIELPGLWETQGLPADARVEIDVAVPDGPRRMLLVDTPQYAARVLWNGAEVERSGDPDGAARADTTLIAMLPPGAGVLTLDVKGDHGEGGVTGRLLLGPVPEVRRVARDAEAQRIGLTLGLTLTALVHLLLATRPSRRTVHLYFGLFALSLALWSFFKSDAAFTLVPDVVEKVRLRRLTLGWTPGLGVAFAAAFVGASTRRSVRALLVLCGLLSLSGLAVPEHLLFELENAQDLLLIVSVPWFGALLVQGYRRRVPGAPLLLLAALGPMSYGIFEEFAVSYGAWSGSSHLWLATLAFVAGSSVALVHRYSRDADRHERLITTSTDGIVCVDANGTVLDANPAAGSLLSHGASNLLERVREADRPLLRAHLVTGAREPARAEFSLIDGRALESMATPLSDGSALLVLRDVTRRQKLAQGMLQAARMETLAVLVGGIAHDFNNLLGTLLGHVGLLQMRIDGELRARLDRMESTIVRASLLTRRLLTVSRGTGAELTAVSLRDVCREAAEMVEPALPDTIRLELAVAADLPPVLGSAGDLAHVIVNLVVNARDATGGRGVVRVGARSFGIPGGARGAVLWVEDDGPGVPRELRDDIFQPFFTTKGAGQGTGLGLAVAAQIARDHLGRIWVEERPGGGARFLLALRHVDAVDEAPAPLPARRSVLLVEDEAALREAWAHSLADAGYEVRAAASAEEALRGDGPVDILVTDVVLPGTNGVELARVLRGRRPELPVLLVSGFMPDDTIPLPRGAYTRLDKPVRTARLVATVGRLCRRAERAAEGELDITEVTWLFPPLEALTAASLGVDTI